MKNPVQKKANIIIFVVLFFCLIATVVFVSSGGAIAKTEPDNAAPEITVDLVGYKSTDLPLGQKDVKYGVFSATAFDLVSGECDVEISVAFMGTNKNLYDAGENCFTPKEAGTYILCYKAEDSSGNIATKKYGIIVKDEVSVPEITCDHEISYALSTGETFRLIDATSTGGSGNVATTIGIYKGETIVSSFDKFYGNSFVPKASGEYTVKYVAKDYLGRQDEKTYSLVVTNSDKPIITSAGFPEYATSGTVFKFSDFTAVDYSGDGREKQAVKAVGISYGGENRTISADQTFTADPVGSVGDVTDLTITLKAQGENGNESKTFTVKVINVKSGDKYHLPSYFVRSGGVSVSSSEAVTFETGSAGETLTSAKAFTADGFRFGFKASSMNSVKITFTDGENSELTVPVSISASSGMKISDVKIEKKISVSFGEEFIIGYAETARSIYFNSDGGNSVIKFSEIEKYGNGKPFAGFPSGKIRLTVEFGEMTGSGKISVTTLGNVTVMNSDLVEDSGAPQMHVDDFPALRVGLGETVYIPKAVAVDVLSELRSFTLSIIAPDGTNILTNGDPTKGFSFKGEQYGIYTINYVATDEKYNKTLNGRFSVTVVDRIKPTITVSGDVPSTAKVGKNVQFPSFNVSDNVSDEDDIIRFIVVITPRYVYYVLGEEREFTPTETGKYKVRYYAEDEDGNYSVSESVLIVE